MSDETFVNSIWADVGVYGYGGTTRYVYLGRAYREFSGVNESAAWSAAAAFTRERLEAIRQLREEIAEQSSAFEKRHCFEHVQCIRRRARQARILSRLESELPRLSAGIKPEALETRPK
jgi:hypothetical protein